MFSAIKDVIRTNPLLFDMGRRAKRILLPEHDAIYAFLDGFSRARRRNVRFVQIGANDGLRNDPLREFVVRDRWSGVLVEPLPSVFPLLKRNYAPYLKKAELIFVNAAISSVDEASLSFYSFSEKFLACLNLEQRLDALRKASFDRSHVERYLDSINRPYECIEGNQVPVMSFETLTRLHFKDRPVDLTLIDAEGHEPKIIRSIEASSFRPDAIVFESHHLDTAAAVVYQDLERMGYKVLDLGGDAAAVRVT